MIVSGNKIAAVEPLDEPATKGEVSIDGAGGTLVAGMYEMHAHTGQEGALLNLIAGITTMRDMGNDNAVLDTLIQRIDQGVIAGPRTEEQWDDYMRALAYRFTTEDEALIDKLVVSGHPSPPGFNDPAYPIEGRKARTR